jgi:hypothetical protein
MKPVKAILGKGRVKKNYTGEANQTGLRCMHIWNCHNTSLPHPIKLLCTKENIKKAKENKQKTEQLKVL